MNFSSIFSSASSPAILPQTRWLCGAVTESRWLSNTNMLKRAWNSSPVHLSSASKLYFFTHQRVNEKPVLPCERGKSQKWQLQSQNQSRVKLGDLEIVPSSINVHSARHCCFTWPAIQPPPAAVIVPVNCFSRLFDYKVSSEWLVYMFQSSFSPPSTPPLPPTLVTGLSRSPRPPLLQVLPSSHPRSAAGKVFSSPSIYHRDVWMENDSSFVYSCTSFVWKKKRINDVQKF